MQFLDNLYMTQPILLGGLFLLLVLWVCASSSITKRYNASKSNSKDKGNGEDTVGLPPEGPTFKELTQISMKAENQQETIRKYGDIFTVPSPLPGIVPTQVVINEPALVKELTIKQANMYRDPSRFTTRGDVFAKATQKVVGVGVTGLKGDEWHWRKMALLKEFHRSRMLNEDRGLLEVILNEGRNLCLELQKAADSQQPVKVDYLTTKAAVGVILFFLFGRVPDFDTEEFRASAKDLMECLMQNLVNPTYAISKFLPGTKAREIELRKVHAWNVIDIVVATEIEALLEEFDGKRPVNPDRKPDSIIASLIKNEPRFRRGGVQSMIAEGRVFVQAGFETTAHSLAFCLGMMAERPDLATDMAHRAKDILGESQNFTYPVDKVRESLGELDVFKNFFLESTRLYPLAPALGGECTQDVTIYSESHAKSYKLPKGTAILFLNIPLQRQIDNPDEIQPHLWEKPPSSQPFLNTFQNGPHSCPGKPLSLLEGQIFLMLAALHFEFEFAPGVEKKVKFEENLLLRPKDGMPLMVKRRSRS